MIWHNCHKIKIVKTINQENRMSFYNPFESNDAGIMGNLQENDLPDFLEEEDEDVQEYINSFLYFH